MPLFPKGPRVYELPEALKRYIQDKAASGISSLTIVPLAFPVFVMNPAEYKPDAQADAPFKAVLRDDVTDVGPTQDVYSSKCPKGEVWEVNTILGHSQLSGKLQLHVYDDSIPKTWRFAQEDAAARIFWVGKLFIQENEQLNFWTDTPSTLTIQTRGVKRYA